MLYIRDTESWNRQIEKLQMLCVLLLSYSVEVSDNHPKIVSSIIGLLEQILDAHVKYFECLKSFSIDSKFFCNVLEFNLLNNLRNVLDKVGIIFERGAPDHPDIAEGVSDVSDQLSELVKVADSSFGGT